MQRRVAARSRAAPSSGVRRVRKTPCDRTRRHAVRPLSTALNDAIGWRETCLVWAALNLLIGFPLNRFALPMRVRPVSYPEDSEGRLSWKPYSEMFLLAFVFAASWFVTVAMASHLPTLLQLAGATRFRSDCRCRVVRARPSRSATC